MKLRKLMGACLLMTFLLSACGGEGTTEDGKVMIEFFQNKPEAKNSFDKLIAKFNEEHPNIEVRQVNPPDAETVLMTRVVKNDVPDVIGMGATDTYSVLAQSNIFRDLAGNKLLDNVEPNYVTMLQDLTGMSEVTGIPYALNASGVMYNKAIFKDLGLAIPTTWDELKSTAQKVKDAGEIPFYFTYKDDWQTSLPFNALGANLVGIDFFKQRRESAVTFQEKFQEVAKKQLELLNYGHGDNFGKGYADGNRAFANGESAMYIQGTWGIAEIRKANPDIEIGYFPLPTGNNADENKLVSGVDTLLTMSKDTEHQQEAEEFMAFLLEPDNIRQYISEQILFSAVKDVVQEDPAVEELLPYFEQGKVIDFPDHYIPSAVQLNSIIQSFLQNKDVNKFLTTLDTEWDKVANRR